MRVSWAAVSHAGLQRPNNEDSYCARPDLGLFVVADGMGGHTAGEVASQTAVSVIADAMHRTATPEGQLTSSVSVESGLSLGTNRLQAAFIEANHRISDLTTNNVELNGMGTTATAILVDGKKAVLAHVGDSRVYRLRHGSLERLTLDHSWVEEQVRSGALSAAMAEQHPWRNIVTQALSGDNDVEVDISEVLLETGDRLLLCSDGLFAVLGDEDIERLLGLEGPLQQVCDVLVKEVNCGGGPDNVTVLVMELDVT